MPVKNILDRKACLPLCGFFLCAVFLSPRGAAQEPAASTAAPAGVQSPLMLNISRNSRESRVGVDYSLRWDFRDLASFKPSLRTIYSGVKAISSWDITENTRVNYYGFRANPWRVLIVKEKIGRPSSVAVSSSGFVSPPASAYRRRVRFSVSPLVDDLERNFNDNLSEFLLRSSLKNTSPEWDKMGDANRKVIVRGLLSLPIWEAPLPLVGEAREGLEYMSRPGKKPVSKPQQPLTISTPPANNRR